MNVDIEDLIFEDLIMVVRNRSVMLDADLARLYGVPTKHLNQQVKRNPERFPEDFLFRLTAEETRQLEHISGAKGRIRGYPHRPFAFTEAGAGMLATVLRNPITARVAVEILRAFRRLRPDDSAPPESVDERKANGLFAAIRDALRLRLEDFTFTTEEPYTYFIQAGEDGPIKIGWTRNLSVRLRGIATILPLPVRLLGVIRGDVEDWCHKRFAAFRVGGEWFAPTPELLDFVREHAKTPPESCQWLRGNLL